MSAKSPQPVLSPIATPRVRRTQGIALVVVLLSAMVLMVSLLAVTSTMVVSSQRTTGDQRLTLQAQYDAESGLAYAKTRTAEAQALFPLLSVPTNTPMSTVLNAVRDFCGGALISNPDVNMISQPRTICDAKPTALKPVSSRTFSVFANYVTSTAGATAADALYVQSYAAMPAGSRTAYWRDVFSGGTPRSAVSTQSKGTAASSFIPDYGFIPDHVDAIPGGYRLFFRPAAASVISKMAGDTTVASRQLRSQSTTPMYSLDVSRRCFCEYNYFANRRRLPTTLGGGSLVFGEADRFAGKVHVNAKDTNNGSPYFSATTSKGGARFYGGFTTATAARYWSTNSLHKDTTEAEMFNNNYKFGVAQIELPTSANGQRHAVVGENSENTTPLTLSQMAAKYGKTSNDLGTTGNFNDGVYYGSGQQKGNTWAGGSTGPGGIYVKGPVNDLKLTTHPASKLQVITIKQTTNNVVTITTFTQKTSTLDADGNEISSWEVSEKVGNASPTTTQITSGKFNGLVFVEGSIGSSVAQAGGVAGTNEGLGGEGTSDQLAAGRTGETPDIAKNTKLTVAASGDIYIKRNLTYTDDPTTVIDNPDTPEDESAQNMLGIYSEGGHIKVDGVKEKNIKINATIMATGKDANTIGTKDGKGFGTIDYNVQRGASVTKAPQIELVGGLIEEQSQGVGVTSTSGGRVTSESGYSRKFDYDARFASGRMPPFFPTQGRFSADCKVATRDDPATTDYESQPSTNSSETCTRDTEDVWLAQGVGEN